MERSIQLLVLATVFGLGECWFPHMNTSAVAWSKSFSGWKLGEGSSCFVVHHGNAVPLVYLPLSNLTARSDKPATIVVIPPHGSIERSLRMDVRFVDFTGIFDIIAEPSDEGLAAPCFVVPPYKPISYIMLQAIQNVTVLAIQELGPGRGGGSGSCDREVIERTVPSCKVIGPPVSFDLPTQPFFLTASETPDPYDISVYTMLTTDRLMRLEEMSRSWPASISAAISITDLAEAPLVTEFWLKHEHMRQHVDVHLVFDDRVPLMVIPDRPFPANFLRNVALRHCRTNTVFYLEADFVPSRDLYANLELPRKYLAEGGKMIFVVASFMAKQGVTADDIPPDKEALLKLMDDEGAGIKKMPYGSHNAFKIANWKEAKEIYQIKAKSGFEPYYVGPRTYPLFDEHFYGCGRDKVSHMQELISQGYRVFVVPQGFIIHLSSEGMGTHWCQGWNKHYRTQWKKVAFLQRIKRTPGILDNVPHTQWWDVGSAAKNSGLPPHYDLPRLPEITMRNVIAVPSESNDPLLEQGKAPPQTTSPEQLQRTKSHSEVENAAIQRQNEELRKSLRNVKLANEILVQRESILQLYCWLSFFVAMLLGASTAFWYRRAHRTLHKLP